MVITNNQSFQVMLQLGGSPNYKDARGLTPLYHCVMHEVNPVCVELLLHDHATIGIQDEKGWYEVHQVWFRETNIYG